LGLISWTGIDSGNAAERYAYLGVQASDLTAGAEDGKMIFVTNKNGTETDSLVLEAGNATFGGDVYIGGNKTFAMDGTWSAGQERYFYGDSVSGNFAGAGKYIRWDYDNNDPCGTNIHDNNSVGIVTNGTTALTINSSQNSTFAGVVTTPGVQRTMVIDPKLYSKDNVYGTDDTRVAMQNDQQTIPLLPGYTITSVLIPTATNRTSFSWDWELCKHDEYATETVISSGNTGSQSGNPWVTMDVTDYTIENEQRVYFRISSVTTSGGTYGYMYNWRVSYTSPTTM
jgi:hypothetical protein